MAPKIGSLIFVLMMFVPIVVLAWSVSPAVGLIATTVGLILTVIGGDAWGGSGPYPRSRRRE